MDYDRLFNVIDDNFLTLDPHWNVTAANPAFLNTLPEGFRTNVIGQDIRSFLPVIVGTEGARYIRQTMEERTATSFVFRHPFTGRNLYTRVYPFDEGIAIMATNFFDPKLADQDLLVREERYRTFIQQSTEGIWRLEAEEPISVSLPEEEQIRRFYELTYLAECSDATAHIYGYDSAQEILGAKLQNLLPASNSRNLEMLRTCIHSGYRLTDAFGEAINRHGYKFYFMANIVGIVEDGMVVRAWGTIRDITRHKLAEDALLQSEERLRLILESAHDYAIFTLDLDGRITSWNAGAERLFQFTEDEIFDTNGEILFPPEDIADGVPQREMTQALATGRAFDERWHIRKDNSRFWGSGQMVPLCIDDGTVLGFLKIVQDQTDRRIAEEQVSSLLESERRARTEAERANRLKDEFLSIVSHELRTPLNAILGWSQLLASEAPSTSPLHEGLEIIQRNAQIQTHIIDDLLDMSRIVSGKITLDLQPVNIGDLVRLSIATLAGNAESKGITVEKNIAPTGTFIGDSSRLQQIIWNLLSNAIKFTPQGGAIRIEVCEDEEAFQIIIADTGRGIAPELLPHIFERFRQGDASSRRQHGGLGLGLAIVKNLVDLHGGDIAVVSLGEGLGATFTVTLPRSIEEHELDASYQQLGLTTTDMESPRVTPRLDGMKILVVDDESDARDLTQRILEQYGAFVQIVSSAEEALDELRRENYHLLISDIGMPNRDGYDLIRDVRSQPPDANGSIPAIALTAFARAEERDRALRAGFNEHLPKPVDAALLVSVVVRLVGR
jgi:PAS domain S-box-containing protein